MSDLKLIAAGAILAALLLLERKVRKWSPESQRLEQKLAREALNNLLRSAVKCQASRILFGVPDNDKMRIRLKQEVPPLHVQAQLDEIDERIAKASLRVLKEDGKKYDSVLADCSDDRERVERLTQIPIISYAEGTEIPVWLETEKNWLQDSTLPFISYGPLLDSLSSAFTSIPKRKDSLLPEYIEIPWDGKRKLYVKSRVRIAADYQISIEILDWIGGE